MAESQGQSADAPGLTSPWNRRVRSYIDELESLVESIDALLDETRVDLRDPDSGQPIDTATPMAEKLQRLEQMIEHREALLNDASAPPRGATLIEKLTFSDAPGDADLAITCDRVSQRLKLAQERSVSLFVCQYHLLRWTGDVVRMIAGAGRAETYDAPGQSRDDRHPGGGLFNEAA